MRNAKTDICRCLGLDIPILQAPMGGATTPHLASAMANHGALGMLPLGNWSMQDCERIIDETLALTSRPIGVNLILEWDQTERLAMSLEKGIKIIWFFWGDPSAYIDQIHDYGAKVILTVGSAEQAYQAVNSGVDIIVSQGIEAGGHIYGQVSSLPLIPAVVDAVSGQVPVVAAGGIGDGRGLAAAWMLGAQGVVLGTRLLSSHEAGIHEQYKQRVLNAKETDTVYTQLFDKGWQQAPMRVLRNSTYNHWQAAGKPESGKRPGEHDIVAYYSPEKPVERYSYVVPSPAMDGDLEPLAHYAGQCVGLVQKKQSVKDILNDIMIDARAAIQYGNNQLQSLQSLITSD